MRLSYNGNTSDFQSDAEGSIPSSRSLFKKGFNMKYLFMAVILAVFIGCQSTSEDCCQFEKCACTNKCPCKEDSCKCTTKADMYPVSCSQGCACHHPENWKR